MTTPSEATPVPIVEMTAAGVRAADALTQVPVEWQRMVVLALTARVE